MPSEQENQSDQIPPQTPSSDEAPGDVVSPPADKETIPMPGDAAEEPVGAPAVATDSVSAVVDPQTEQPDGAVEPIDDDEVAGEALGDEADKLGVDVPTLEALVFSTHHPLTGGRLAELLDVPSTKPIRKAIRVLNESYEQSGRCFRIEQVAGGFQMLTLADYGPAVQVLNQREADSRLTKAALETLAIVAYKQPILRADVEAIRGVASGETIRSLMEKHLVKIAGRAELPGRPILYGTTKRFLEVFGLNSLRDLPQAENLPKAASRPAVQAPAEEPAAPPAEPAAAEGADGDDQAVNEATQLTHQAAEQEAAVVQEIAQPTDREAEAQAAPDVSEAVDEAQSAEPADLPDDADDGAEPRPE